jgi:hypothetical protein
MHVFRGVGHYGKSEPSICSTALSSVCPEHMDFPQWQSPWNHVPVDTRVYVILCDTREKFTVPTSQARSLRRPMSCL